MKKLITAAISAAILMPAASAAGTKLTGTVLESGHTDRNAGTNAFDGNLQTTFFGLRENAEYSRPWVGLDLGTAHVIDQIRFAPSSESKSCSRLAIFQGANNADWSDAMPIAMVPVDGPKPGQYFSIPVEVSRGFRYVRMVGAGGAQQNVAELEFYGTPGQGDDSRFFQVTNIPTVAFNTPGMAQITSKDDKHPDSQIFVIYDGGTKLLEKSGQMKGRGNASWGMPKKPFQIKFDKKQQILPDAPATAKKWTLINNYGDKTLMRNKVAFDMSREAGMAYTPYCRFVDVIYNGEYEGCYQLCDQVEVNPGRVELTEMEPEDIAGDALTGGYFLEVDGYADQEASWFMSDHDIPVTIKSPDEDDITAQQSAYIKNHFQKMEKALWSSKFTDPDEGYRRYIDLESFLRYVIVCELDGNTDTFWSTYMSKERGSDRFVFGPIWDIDLGFDNDNRTYPVNSLNDFVYATKGSTAGRMNDLANRIVKSDAAARAQLSEIWSRLRKHGNYNSEYFNNLVDTYADEISESQRLNFVRWPILSEYVHQNPRVLGSFEAEVNAMKDYITARFDKLDRIIGLVDVPGDAITGVESDTPFSPEAYYTLDGILLPSRPVTPGIYVARCGTVTRKIAVR